MSSPSLPAPASAAGSCAAPARLEEAVRRRYSAGATRPQPGLCSPVSYDPALLAAIPDEILERDYGCGDPSRHVAAGETVLDLGSGAGKACFMAAQRVGAAGRVIGIDVNDDMLALARRGADLVAQRLGYANVEFRKAAIEDLALDVEALDAWLALHPVADAAALAALTDRCRVERRERPLVADASVDVVLSNCVLNLVHPERKRDLFREIHRVLRPGGRAVISDIVCDEDVPEALARDPELWSACISGTLREDRFVGAFESAGFHGLRILERSEAPWHVVQGLHFRSLTVEAWRGEDGPCLEQRQAVIYRGPWASVTDDEGHVLPRGRAMAVCGRTFRRLTGGPYVAEVLGVEPVVAVPEAQAEPFPCTGDRARPAAETKAGASTADAPAAAACCEPGSCC